MSTAIVYYSLNGNSEFTAKKIAEKIGADLIKLVPVKAYPKTYWKQLFWGGKSVVMKEKPNLEPYTFDADKYDTIIMGTPVWASTYAPPISTFLAEHGSELKGKRIAAFTCFTASGDEKTYKKLKETLGIDSLYATLGLADPKDKPVPDNEGKIDEFCEKFK
ncbi:MAG: flavodoxin [Ruminococcus sp.]|nr:flavodoxin [Ruminococcus sp.]